MRTITLITALLITCTATSQIQYSSELDSKHGFKGFTLGDTIAKWKPVLQYYQPNDDGSVSYIYTGKEYREIFRFSIKDIELKFFKNKLVGIYLTTEFFEPSFEVSGVYPGQSIEEFESLNDQLSSLFGVAVPVVQKDILKNVWIGKTTTLITQYDYQGISKGGRAYVIVLDAIFENQIRKQGF